MLQWSNIGEGAFWCSLNLSAKFLADSPIPSQEFLQQQPLYIPDETMESEPYAEAKNEHISPKSPPKNQDMDLDEDTEDSDEIHKKVFESIEEEDQSKGDSWFNANVQMVLTKVPWPVMI